MTMKPDVESAKSRHRSFRDVEGASIGPTEPIWKVPSSLPIIFFSSLPLSSSDINQLAWSVNPIINSGRYTRHGRLTSGR